MRKTKYLLLFVLALFLSCDDDDFLMDNDCVEGQGSVITESRVLGDFHSIVNTVYADILITQGPVEDIIIEAQSNILDVLETDVVNQKLTIKSDPCIDISQAITIHITIPEIRNLTITGAGDVIAQNDLTLNEVNLTLTGAGSFMLLGTASTLNITLTGAGNVSAFGLMADSCNVVITGAGNAEVFVINELDVTISGVGSVYYKGDPVINSSITGVGNIVDAN